MKGARGYLIVAAIVGLVMLGLQSLLHTDLRERNVEIFTEMVYSKAAESFGSSPELPGGLTQQPLVAGVVRRGHLPLYYGPGPEEALRAGAELTNPFARDDEVALEKGRRLFGIYCTPCHDPGGNGRGLVMQRGPLQIAPSFHAARAVDMPDGGMFHVLTHGQGNMASYAAQLTREERWQVILHVRKLQQENQE